MGHVDILRQRHVGAAFAIMAGMKIHLNREFALRHLGVAILFLGLCGWFLYDGAVAYPKMDEAVFREQVLHGKPGDLGELRRQAIGRQYQFAGICVLAALLISAGVARCRLQTLEWDETRMCGSLTAGRPLPFDDVVGVDERRWEKKGILVVVAKDGRRVTLDTWHHAGARELAEKILARRAAPHGSGREGT